MGEDARSWTLAGLNDFTGPCFRRYAYLQIDYLTMEHIDLMIIKRFKIGLLIFDRF
jgi:hypothetical protein